MPPYYIDKQGKVVVDEVVPFGSLRRFVRAGLSPVAMNDGHFWVIFFSLSKESYKKLRSWLEENQDGVFVGKPTTSSVTKDGYMVSFSMELYDSCLKFAEYHDIDEISRGLKHSTVACWHAAEAKTK